MGTIFCSVMTIALVVLTVFGVVLRGELLNFFSLCESRLSTMASSFIFYSGTYDGFPCDAQSYYGFHLEQ